MFEIIFLSTRKVGHRLRESEWLLSRWFDTNSSQINEFNFNSVKTLDSLYFRYYSLAANNWDKITKLDVSSKSIEALEKSVFQSLISLKTLKMERNKIKSLDKQIFQGKII